VLERCSRL